MTAPPAPPDVEPTIADRILERLNLELEDPAQPDNGIGVAALAIAYDRLKPAGPTHEELGALEVKLAASETELERATRRVTELEAAIADVVRAANGLGARSELLLDGVLQPVGYAIINGATLINATTIGRPA